jgi:hypothetical protein
MARADVVLGTPGRTRATTRLATIVGRSIVATTAAMRAP